MDRVMTDRLVAEFVVVADDLTVAVGLGEITAVDGGGATTVVMEVGGVGTAVLLMGGLTI